VRSFDEPRHSEVADAGASQSDVSEMDGSSIHARRIVQGAVERCEVGHTRTKIHLGLSDGRIKLTFSGIFAPVTGNVRFHIAVDAVFESAGDGLDEAESLK
jgi:hypothetical protein